MIGVCHHLANDLISWISFYVEQFLNHSREGRNISYVMVSAQKPKYIAAVDAVRQGKGRRVK